jgi:hypothetical protein
MKKFNIKVTEFGIKKGESIHPSHYTLDYCTQKKIPYIIVRPKTKYSNIDYDLITVDNGLAFKKGYSIIDHWWEIYEDYVSSSSFPRNKIPLRIIGVVTDNFTVFKKDQEIIVNMLLKEIEKFVNEYGVIDPKRKKYFEGIKKRNEINEQREKYLENISRINNDKCVTKEP